MAIFRVPRITTAQRTPLVLLDGEIVYDTDTLNFYGGDGVTAGGIQIGSGGTGTGLPVGGLAGYVLTKNSPANFDVVWDAPGAASFDVVTDIFTLDSSNLISKKIKLSQVPKSASAIKFSPDGGPDQRFGVDYTLSGDEIIWEGFTLDGFLEVGEVIRVTYPT